MQVKYDKEADAKYVRIKRGKIHETQELEDWLLVDCDKDGEVLGVEILDASEHEVECTTISNTLVGIRTHEKEEYRPEKIRQKMEDMRDKALAVDACIEPSAAVAKRVQVASV